MEIFKDHMLVDAALRREIIARAIGGGFGDEPDRAVHELGQITMPDGESPRVHLRHAADAILLDDKGQVVLITRVHNPGAGRLALPGGFLDEVDGVVESSLTAAIREAVEETGIDAVLLRDGRPEGPRRYDRPFDIRRAWSDIPGTSIREGQLFAVSTRGFRFRLGGNLRETKLLAGDDAGAVGVYRIKELSPDQFAVPDHLEMITAALG